MSQRQSQLRLAFAQELHDKNETLRGEPFPLKKPT